MTTYTLSSDTPATLIPAGESACLAKGEVVHVVQSLGGNVTVRTNQGLFQIAREHTGAIAGFSPEPTDLPELKSSQFSEQLVWDAMKTCFDPEIPVNIVDLGLVYDLSVEKLGNGRVNVEVKMTLTAPGCGMGPVIAEDARKKIADLPTVASAKVHIVWDPIWTPQMISPEGRKALGLE